jgi:predicted type IV restriction endonuclease
MGNDAEFAELLSALANDPDLIGVGEEATKHALILPILERLGWDVRSIREVVPEYAVEDGRVDYCLAIDRRPKVFVEVKAVDRDLQDHQKQLLQYAFNRGVELACLTNGFSWWLYLPLLDGTWEERKFFVVDIREQSAANAAGHLIRFLSKATVASGTATKEAREARESSRRQDEIGEALPEAWERLATEPDQRLVDLLLRPAYHSDSFA